MLPSQLDERVGLRPKEIDVRAQLSISRSLVVGHILQKLLASEEEDVILVDLESDEAGGKVEGVGEKVSDHNILPFICVYIIPLDVDLLVLGDSKAVNRIIESGGRLMRLNRMKSTYLSPLFHLQ